MTTTSQSLVFTPTTTSVSVGAAFVIVVAGLGLLAWRRSGYRTSPGLLEGLRLLIAVVIAVTLNQPEWREVFKPESKPELVVLGDVSRSMETRDVLDPAKPAAEPKSRAEAARPLLDKAAWAAIADRMEVSVEPFSSGATAAGGGDRSECRAGPGGREASAPESGGAAERR